MNEEIRQLLIDADSLLSLIIFRHPNNGIPADLQEEARRLVGRLRAAYEHAAV